MNEYRAALQALVHELNQQQDEWTRSRWPAFAAAVALLARPEKMPCRHFAIAPKGTMHYHGFVSDQQNQWRCSECGFIQDGNLTDPARPEPRTQRLYVFLQQRPCDKQAWPLVYVDQALAEAAPHRVTPVVVVNVPMPTDQGLEAQR